MLDPWVAREGGANERINVYYLDMYQLHVRTNKIDRIKVRTSYNRDKEMAYKLELQKNRCFWCAVHIDMSGHLDHIIPIYYGGQNYSRNLVASCRSCNLTKGTGHIEITSPYTIVDYKKLIRAKTLWEIRLKDKTKKEKRVPKRVQLYDDYHAELFKEI